MVPAHILSIRVLTQEHQKTRTHVKWCGMIMFSDFLSRSFLFTFFYIYWKCSFLSSSSSSSLSFVAGASTMLLLLFFVTSYLIRSLALCAFFLSLDFSFFFVRHLRVSLYAVKLVKMNTKQTLYTTTTWEKNIYRKIVKSSIY